MCGAIYGLSFVQRLPPPLLVHSAHNDPLELSSVEAMVVGVAENSSRPSLIEVGQDDSYVLVSKDL